MHGVLLWSAVAIAALAAATATFLVIAAPTDLVRDQIVQLVRDRTGRELTIAGGTSLTLFPSMGLAVKDASLSPPPGMDGEPLARIAEMEVRMTFWPLLSGQLQIEQIVLRRPELNLRIDADGRRSWDFRRRGADRDSATRRSGAEAGAGGTRGERKLDSGAALRSLAFADVRIEDGIMRYADERRGFREEVSQLNLDIGLASVDSPLEARGDLKLNDEKVDITARLDSLATLLSGTPAPFSLNLSGRPLEATYEGTLATGSGTTLDGALSVKSGSLRGLAVWAGLPESDGEDDGPLTLTGKLETTQASVAIKDAHAQIAGTDVKGFAVLETRTGNRPRLSADLHLSALDLTHWLTNDGPPASTDAPRGGGGAISGAGIPAQPGDNRPEGSRTREPQVRGFVARHGWSDVPFDLIRLGRADADLRLAVEHLTYRNVKAGPTRITATLADRVVDATIDEMLLYEGTGRGAVRLDASRQAANLDARFQLDDVNAQDFLNDAAEFDWVAGKGRVSFAITGQGRSEREIVESLDGTAEFSFRNGALVGFDIPGMIAGLKEGRIPRLARNKADRTAFSKLAATFNIKDGIAENRDLELESALLHVTGAGSANLPRRTLDYTAKPKLLAAAPAHPGGQPPPGIELPVRITGSWDRPEMAADFNAVIHNPGQVIETAKEIGKQFKGKKIDDALRDFLNEEDDGNKTKKKARDFLRQFIKPQ